MQCVHCTCIYMYIVYVCTYRHVDKLTCRPIYTPMHTHTHTHTVTHTHTHTHLQHWPSSQRYQLQTLRLVHFRRQSHQMVKQKLCRLCLSRATLSADNHRLILTIAQHRVIRTVGNRKYVRGQFLEGFPLIHGGVFRVVNGVKVVGVDGDEDRTSVGVD